MRNQLPLPPHRLAAQPRQAVLATKRQVDALGAAAFAHTWSESHMLAAALAPLGPSGGGLVLWRAFVYGSKISHEARARQAQLDQPRRRN